MGHGTESAEGGAAGVTRPRSPWLLRVLTAGAPKDRESALCASLLNAAILVTAAIMAVDAVYAASFYLNFDFLALPLELFFVRWIFITTAFFALYLVSASGRWQIARVIYLTLMALYFIPYNEELFAGNNADFMRLAPLPLPFLLFRSDETRLGALFFILYCGNIIWAGLLAHSGFPATFDEDVYVLGSSPEAGNVLFIKQHFNSLAIVAFAMIASAATLRALLAQQLKAVEAQRARSERILDNLFPPAMAERLRAGERHVVEARSEAVLVLLDVVGFTPLSRRLSPTQLVETLDRLFAHLDRHAAACKLEKVKTIGDAYLAAAGLTEKHDPEDAANAARFALLARDAVRAVGEDLGHPLDCRIGVHLGPAVAGVLGEARAVFDVWGDAVNMASRIESAAAPGEILLSEPVYFRVRRSMDCEAMPVKDLKGMGSAQLYRLLCAKDAPANDASDALTA